MAPLVGQAPARSRSAAGLGPHPDHHDWSGISRHITPRLALPARGKPVSLQRACAGPEPHLLSGHASYPCAVDSREAGYPDKKAGAVTHPTHKAARFNPTFGTSLRPARPSVSRLRKHRLVHQQQSRPGVALAFPKKVRSGWTAMSQVRF